jgi:hypothetical protein
VDKSRLVFPFDVGPRKGYYSLKFICSSMIEEAAYEL